MSGVNICLSLQSVMSPNSDYRQKVDFNPGAKIKLIGTLDLVFILGNKDGDV